jgi:hypothetical protein
MMEEEEEEEGKKIENRFVLSMNHSMHAVYENYPKKKEMK